MELKFGDMKRAELQKLAKKAGIKANMKTEELIKALIAHHSQANQDDDFTEEVAAEKSATTAQPAKVNSESEQTNDTKSQRAKRGRGRGRKKTPPADNEPEKEPQQPQVTDIAPESNAESKSTDKEEKTGRRGQRSKRKRTSAAVTMSSDTVVMSKSAQKRGLSDTEEEVELPPAKQQRVSPSQDKNNVPESAEPSTRRSTRKRTFSMSPKSEVTQKDSQSEQGMTKTAKDEEINAIPETEAKRLPQSSKEKTTETIPTDDVKTSPKKTVPANKKTGIPLPKIKASSENVTPGKSLNFKKVHKAQFDKLESIDDYLERKRKRIEALTQSYRKAPSCSKKTPNRAQKAATPKDDSKPAKKRTSFFSPKPSKPAAKTVTFHASRLKTPAKPSTFIFGKTSTEKRMATPGARKSIAVMGGSANRKSVAGSSTTPFKFTGCSANTPSSKKSFDLQASLQKPLPYKPYTGKLKPLSEIQPSKLKPVSHIAKAKENLKKPKLSSRQERQRAATKHRAQSRKDNMMARRGLSVA